LFQIIPPVANCHRWQLATGINVTSGVNDVIDTGGKFANISPKFQKNEMTLILFTGAWGKMVHEKKT
jgi:hypothetical protein